MTTDRRAFLTRNLSGRELWIPVEPTSQAPEAPARAISESVLSDSKGLRREFRVTAVDIAS